MLKALRLIALLEGLSLLILLFIAMPLKYFMDMPMAVKHVGMAHGLLFLAYIGLLLYVGISYSWKFKTLLIAGIASVIPFGTFYADKKYFKS